MNCVELIVNRPGCTLHVRKQCFGYAKYLHVTFTLKTWLTVSYSFVAVQRYVPEAARLMFGKFQVGLRSSISPSLPSSSTLVKVIFGVGLPVASQTKVMFDPLSTVWSRLTSISLTGTENRDTMTVTHPWHSMMWCGFVRFFKEQLQFWVFTRSLITKWIGMRGACLS